MLKIGHLVLAAFLLVLGVLLVADPSLQVGWKYACGVFLILLGAVKITGFLSKDLYRLAFQYDSIYGVLLIGIGLIFLVRPVLTVESTWLLLGIFVFHRRNHQKSRSPATPGDSESPSGG
ncbi:MAG: hypothetical protein L6V84_06355 [Oscillospiraceae bacterium]|nr:MAG: hypothetical protein L6V84_06355 [Oscillospiraceae bacterium]